ncbi:MAG: hypothetical protein ACE5NP_06530 [Anaerolineae bacterium]
MFGFNTYLILTLLFALPPIALLWWRHFRLLWQEKGLICFVTFLATSYGFFVWPVSMQWQSWAYSKDQIIGLWVIATALEDIVWWLLISFLFASFVVVASHFEEQKQPLLKSILKVK